MEYFPPFCKKKLHWHIFRFLQCFESAVRLKSAASIVVLSGRTFQLKLRTVIRATYGPASSMSLIAVTVSLARLLSRIDHEVGVSDRSIDIKKRYQLKIIARERLEKRLR